jgi:hypothetical protein
MPSWLISSFLHPEYLLPGAALLSLPLIVHLLNRMRFRRVKFAAMSFLLASQHRNQRRVLLEQLLLLLVRTILVGGLVALIARPILTGSDLAWLQSQRTLHVVLLDDSASMQDSSPDGAAFERGVRSVLSLSAELARRSGTQQLTVFVGSRPTQPVILQRTLDPESVADVRARLEALRCTSRRVDLAAAFESAFQALKAEAGVLKLLHVVSDFRSADWRTGTPLAAALQAAAEIKAPVQLVRTVAERHDNIALVELTGSTNIAAAGVPLRLSATVRNLSAQAVRDVRVDVLLNGEKLPAGLVYDAIEAGQDATRQFDVVPPKPGSHEVRVSLLADRFEPDNVRVLAVDAPESNAILIVEGNPSRADALTLADALAPGPNITGLAPTIDSVDDLRRRSLAPFQTVYMVNVPELPAETVTALESFVSAGGGLVWYLGDQVKPREYNSRLYRGGAGLFPAPLSALEQLPPPDTPDVPDLVVGDHPAFRVFAGEDNPFIDLVRVESYFRLADGWKPDDSVRVAASLRNGDPLVLEKRFGKGRIAVCLTGFGGLPWSNWSQNPSFVVMSLELERYIARDNDRAVQILVGDPISFSVDPAVYSADVEVRLPSGVTERLSLTAQQRPSTGEPRADASAIVPLQGTFVGTEQVGLYVLTQSRVDGTLDQRSAACNVDVNESRLDIADNATVSGVFPDGVRLQFLEAGGVLRTDADRSEQDIRETLLIAVLALLMLEQVLAWRFSYHPSMPRGAVA